MSYDICDEHNTKELAEHFILTCSRYSFEVFRIYSNLYEIFRAHNKTRLTQLTAFIKTADFSSKCNNIFTNFMNP